MPKTISISKQNPKEYQAWCGMLTRCRPNDGSHVYYHDRGIGVCDEWKGDGGFERFLSHVGKVPSPKFSLDRVDNDGDYKPGNVRWCDRATQMGNRRMDLRKRIDQFSDAQSFHECRKRGVIRWNEFRPYSIHAMVGGYRWPQTMREASDAH